MPPKLSTHQKKSHTLFKKRVKHTSPKETEINSVDTKESTLFSFSSTVVARGERSRISFLDHVRPVGVSLSRDRHSSWHVSSHTQDAKGAMMQVMAQQSDRARVQSLLGRGFDKEPKMESEGIYVCRLIL